MLTLQIGAGLSILFLVWLGRAAWKDNLRARAAATAAVMERAHSRVQLEHDIEKARGATATHQAALEDAIGKTRAEMDRNDRVRSDFPFRLTAGGVR